MQINEILYSIETFYDIERECPRNVLDFWSEKGNIDYTTICSFLVCPQHAKPFRIMLLKASCISNTIYG